MSEEHLEAVRRSFRALATEDLQGLDDLIEPDVEFLSQFAAEEGRSYRGMDGALEYVADIQDIWETFDREIVELVDADNAVMAIVDISAVARRTGAEVRQRIGMVFWFRGDRFYRVITYREVHEALEAAGLI